MAAKPPIPKDGAEAFNKAVAAFYNWTVEEQRDSLIEPHIVQRYSIGAVCDLIRAFDDPMPENVYQFLTWLAAKLSGDPPADRSYASGAKCLKALRDKHLSRIETSHQADP
jgi:hypothetical protein